MGATTGDNDDSHEYRGLHGSPTATKSGKTPRDGSENERSNAALSVHRRVAHRAYVRGACLRVLELQRIGNPQIRDLAAVPQILALPPFHDTPWCSGLALLTYRDIFGGSL
jgi:hypothetical protein